jgi:DNA-directed RNA polymerase specialized sigma24 family protein
MRPARAPPIAPVGSTEAELVRRARERDEPAIRSIMQSNNRRLYRLARGILRNDGEAEDVVQETYVRAFTHLQDFRGDSSLATWLGRIAPLAERESTRASQTKAIIKSRANPKADAAMKLLLPGAPNPEQVTPRGALRSMQRYRLHLGF